MIVAIIFLFFILALLGFIGKFIGKFIEGAAQSETVMEHRRRKLEEYNAKHDVEHQIDIDAVFRGDITHAIGKARRDWEEIKAKDEEEKTP